MLAQGITVNAKTDTNTILIGQQFHINLEASYPKNSNVSWFLVPDSIGKLQIVERGKIDTVANAAMLQLRQSITVTGFDSGMYAIPPFQLAYRNANDTTTYFATTNPLAITINTVAVDTTKEIRDIKGPIEVPYTFADFLPYIIALLLAGLLAYGIYYYIKKSRQKTVVPVKYVPKRPAHEIALEDLIKLRDEKVWQQGNIKDYHTRVTEIVRTYIERRFKINALEFTTNELMSSLAIKSLNDDLRSKLNFTLTLADMVKFAKGNPLPDEHEQSMSNSIAFIEATKAVAQPTAAKEVSAS
jgi:hypothetical protein